MALPAFLGLALALASSLGCTPYFDPSTRTVRSEISAHGLDPDQVLVPFQLTPEMRSWVHGVVPDHLPPDQRAQALLEALVQLDGLNLQYKPDVTGTAAEVFETRQANCLAFTHLFIAMARAIGLNAYFLQVEDIETFAQEGDLVINAGHITAGTGPSTAPRVLDFSDRTDIVYRNVRKISDLRAIALFYSNRGAERIRRHDPEAALPWLETATRLDPHLADGWVNLGVVLRRLGDTEGAEAAYRRALEEDPHKAAAYHNLAALYRHIGREDLVQPLLEAADQAKNRNPFTYLRLGDINLMRGNLDAAERFYRRAAQLDPELAAAWAALGDWAARSGKERAARRWLHHAQRLDADDSRAAALARRLGEAGS
ncbi:MAG: tetratricopeptide repeat protein [Acidobacteria bacterium]|nr:tetratricopeptide repeat protein [Acidobacteriota bacterium]